MSRKHQTLLNRVVILSVCLLLFGFASTPRAASGAPPADPEAPGALENPVYLPLVFRDYDPLQWNAFQRVDTPVYFADMTNRSLVLVNGINPCVVYGGDHLYYACNGGSGWVKQVIDNSFGVGRFASQALDKTGSAHIAYYDETNGALKYARGSGTTWTITTVDAAPPSASAGWAAEIDSLDAALAPLSPEGIVSGKHGRGTDTSIVVDGNNRPHISYYDTDNRVLKYATFNGSQWVVQIVDATPGVGTFTSIALDAGGFPHIAYYDATYKRLKYASFSGAAWWTTVIDDRDDAGQYASLAFDSNGNAGIAYYVYADKTGEEMRGDLRYAWWNGVGFVVDSVYSSGDVGKYASLAFDSRNNPGIGYYVDIPERGFLRYNYKDGADWDDGTVIDQNVNTAVGRNISMLFDKNGNKTFSYYSPAAGDFRYAYWSTSFWNITTFDSSTNTGLWSSLKLDSLNRPHIAYMDETHDDLVYTYWTGSAWATPLKLATAVDNGLQPSLALDASNYPHITYWDNRHLLYTYRSASGWSTEVISADDNVGYYSSLALTSAGKVVLSYYDGSNGDLKYAERISGVWHISTVDSDGDVGSYTSLALDSLGHAVISYYDSINRRLKLARWDGSLWNIEVVDGSYGVGYYTSLELAAGDRPMISYFDKAMGLLKFAEWTGSTWRYEVVDTGGVGSFSSLELGNQDVPYISYYDGVKNDLKIAFRPAPGYWLTRTVDRGGDVGQYGSLALQDGWRMHISYADLTNGDLKYVMQKQ